MNWRKEESLRSHACSPSISTSLEHTVTRLTSLGHTITKTQRYPSSRPHPETHTPNTTSEGDTSLLYLLPKPPSLLHPIPYIPVEGGGMPKPYLHRRPLTQGGMPKPAILLSCTTPERNLPFPGPIPIPHTSFRQRPRSRLAGLSPRSGLLEVKHGRGDGAHDRTGIHIPATPAARVKSRARVASHISVFRAAGQRPFQTAGVCGRGHSIRSSRTTQEFAESPSTRPYSFPSQQVGGEGGRT